MSWSGRGSDDESRERVIAAARRSGMSVSELVQALAEEPTSRSSREPLRHRRGTEADPSSTADLDRQLDRLSERLKRLSSADDTTARRARLGVDRSQDSILDEIASTVDRLSRSVDAPRGARASASRPLPDEGFDKILQALDGLDQRVRALGETRPKGRAREIDPNGNGTPAAETGVRGRRTRAAVGDLDRAISEISDRQSALEASRGTRAPTGLGADLDRHFRELGEKIDLIRTRDDRDQTSQLMAEIKGLREIIERRATVGADVSDEIQRLAGKIDELAAHRPQRDMIEPLMTEVGRLRDVVLQGNVEGSLKSIEAGYGHIVDRLDDLKRGLAGPRVEAKVDAEISEIHTLLRAFPQVAQFSAIERNFRELAEKVDRLAGRDESDKTSLIESRIAELRTHLDSIDPSPVVRALDQRLKAVTDKLDSIERVARGPVAPERMVALIDELRTIAAGSRSGEEIKALEQRIVELAERIGEFDRRRPSFDDTDRLHERLADLTVKIEGMTAPGTDRRTVDMLEAMLGRLDEMMARPVPVAAPDRGMETRVAALIDRLEKDDRPNRTADVDALTREIAEMRKELHAARSNTDLEAQMRLLAERLDRSSAQEPDDETLTQIEDQLARISQQLAATDGRTQNVAAIEAGIKRLGERLETSQASAIEAARDAAREMMREIGSAHTDGISDAVLRALQDDLRSLQSAARDTESRTNDTLISLHDALTGIVGRLSAIEKIAQGSARTAAAAVARAGVVAPEAPRESVNRAAPPFEGPVPPSFSPTTPASPAHVAQTSDDGLEAQAAPTIAGRPVMPTSALTRARELLTSASEDSRPLEPGSGKPNVRPTPQPAPTKAQTAPVGPSGEPVPAASRKADFIAAARRAAQAAASAAPSPLAAQPEDRAVPPVDGNAPTTEGGSGTLARIGQALKSRRRPLVLATAALVLAVLTLQLMPGSGERQAELSPATNRTETASNVPTAPAKSVVRAIPPQSNAPQVDAATTIVAPTTMPEPEPPAPSAPAAPQASVAAPAPATTKPEVPPSAPAASLSSTPTQRTSELSLPTPDASNLLAPITTGSVPTGEAQRPMGTAASSLPSQIGSDTLRTAAESGDPRAAFEVGMRFAEGRGVPADAKQAAEWYRRAADKGQIPAIYRLAAAYEKGLGIERNSDEAKRLYQSAAEKGNVRAMHNLAVLHANGRDMAAALPWFQKAADLGLKDSQFNLGIIYALGSGVKQDLAVSYKWFALAARQGDKEAEKKQNDVAAHLDKVNLAAARMAVQTWVQRPLDRDANDETEVWVEAPTKATATNTRDLVAQAQNLLKANGLYKGPVTGEMTAQTRTAIKAFQKKAGLAQTGEIDPILVKALIGKAM